MTGGRRVVGWPAVLGLLLAWLTAGLVGALLGTVWTGTTDDAYAAPHLLLTHVGLPAALSLGVAAAATTGLRWWAAVAQEDRRLRRGAWLAPLAMVAGSAACADWSRLGHAGPALVGALACAVVLVAASEELMFRGVVLHALRDRHREGMAALLTTLLFAVAHVLVGGGLANLGQGVFTLLGGFLYYVTRRVSGGLVAPIAVHAWWDLMAFSVLLGPGRDADTMVFETAVVLALVVLLVGALWRPLSRPRPPAGAGR